MWGSRTALRGPGRRGGTRAHVALSGDRVPRVFQAEDDDPAGGVHVRGPEAEAAPAETVSLPPLLVWVILPMEGEAWGLH